MTPTERQSIQSHLASLGISDPHQLILIAIEKGWATKPNNILPLYSEPVTKVRQSRISFDISTRL